MENNEQIQLYEVIKNIAPNEPFSAEDAQRLISREYPNRWENDTIAWYLNMLSTNFVSLSKDFYPTIVEHAFLEISENKYRRT